jgi:hypothetical protein
MDILTARRCFRSALAGLCVASFLSACALNETKQKSFTFTATSPAATPAPSATPDISAPADVSGLSVTDGDEQSILNWTPPVDADFSGVYISIPSESHSTVVYKGSASCTVGALVNGTEYDATVSTFDGTGNLSAGIPVQLRPDKLPSIRSISPVAGNIAGGTSLTITGTGLLRTTGVNFGGSPASDVTIASDTSITCLTPASVRGFIDVTAAKAVGSSTLHEAFSFIDPAIVAISWANLQYPPSMSAIAGSPSALVFGRVLKTGVTGGGLPPAGILAQAGYGPLDSDPRDNADWTWIDAVFNMPYAPESEFMATFTVMSAGSYSYCYRFSDDGGSDWIYGDCDGNLAQAASTNGFDPAGIGVLTVTP